MKYHLVGDQGVSMRGIAKILKGEGHNVTGSDLKTGGHSPENITKDIDILVRTSAVSEGSPGWVEVEKAKKLGIVVKKRSEIIAELTKDKYLISVSGMHGKTTTTSLIGLALVKAELDPTVLVGEDIREFGGVVRLGKSKYFVLEACEYDKSFYDFKPDIAVVLNLDLEHLDTFPAGWPDIESAFKKYFSNIKDGGTLIYNGGDKRLKKIAESLRGDIKKVDYVVEKEIKTPLMGQHNQQNIAAAIKVMDILGIKYSKYSRVFMNFKGASRRLEYKGEINGMKVYDDYGHHPTEIEATIKALKGKYSDKKILTIFWPHQYKRIEPLKNEFVKALSLSDKIILKPIYFVPGRDEKRNIDSQSLAATIGRKKASVIEDDDKIVKEVKEKYNKDWIVLTAGIPPIYEVADKLVN